MANRPAILGRVSVPLSAFGITDVGSGAIITAAERARLAAVEASNHVAASLAALGLNGDGTTDDRATLQSLITARAAAGIPLVLPKATYVIDLAGTTANEMSLPANTTIFGNGATWIIKGPPAVVSTFAIRLAGGNVRITDLTISWPATISAVNNKPAPGVVSGIFYAVAHDNITLKRVKLHGPGLLQDTWKEACQLIEMRGCNDVVMEDVEAKWSLGTWGMQLIGGSRHRYNRFKVLENAGDGIKINEDATYGLPNRMTFVDSDFNDNGAFFQQGQDAGSVAVTLTATNATNGSDLVAYYDKRVRLNPTSGAIDIHLPPSPGDGTEIIFSKVAGSNGATYRVQDGEYIRNGGTGTSTLNGSLAYVTSTSYPNDYNMVRMKAISSPVVGWEYDGYSNGEGVDMVGHDIHFVTSEASRNEGAGFQVKPNDDSTAYNVSFSSCMANDQWAGHGFAIVQAIGDGGEVNTPGPNAIAYNNCHATGNRQKGFMFTTTSSRPITNVSMANVVARNNGHGFELGAGCRQFSIVNAMAIGNGKSFNVTSSYNFTIRAGKGHRIVNLLCDGVDPTAQDLRTHSTIEGGTAECQGLLLYKTYGTGSDNEMDDVVIRGFRGIRNNVDVLYALNSSFTLGDSSDFDSSMLLLEVDETPEP